MKAIRKSFPLLLSFIVVFVLVFLAFSPSFTLAQGSIPKDPLVPCGINPFKGGDGECNFCHLVELIRRVFLFIVGISAFIVTLMLAWGGLKLIVSGDNEESRGTAKRILKDALIGFLIVILAGEIVNLILVTLVNPNERQKGWWYGAGFKCTDTFSKDITTITSGGLTTSPGTQTQGACLTCTQIPADLPVKSTGATACHGGGTCQVSSQIVPNLISFKTELENSGINTSQWQITEAWPPTGYSSASPNGIHSTPCHGFGTCVDVNFTGNNTSPQNIVKMSQAASKAGFRAEYEVSNRVAADALRASLPANSNVIIKVVPQITAPHFSLYKI